MLRDLLNEQVVAINQKAKNWEEAIRIAGSILMNTGKCKESYIEAMIDVVKTYGPYIVIEDGIAMPHAKSSLDVNEDGLAIVTLKKPVDFHNRDFENVSVLFAICATNPDAHLNFLQELSGIFETENLVERMCSCKEEKEILKIIEENIAQPKGESKCVL